MYRILPPSLSALTFIRTLDRVGIGDAVIPPLVEVVEKGDSIFRTPRDSLDMEDDDGDVVVDVVVPTAEDDEVRLGLEFVLAR